ncbi:MAG: DpnI domain-containing protein [Acidobacteriaceae bacterium]
MDVTAGMHFKSASQRARVLTEYWARDNLYCAACTSSHLLPCPPNTQAVDFTCPECDACYQLKSQSCNFGMRIVDAGYAAMCRAILSDRVPNLVLLHYEKQSWTVQNSLLVPSFAFSLSAIEQRKPLAPTARRAGWVGCNILLGKVPPDLRIPLVERSVSSSASEVRDRYQMMSNLKNIGVSARGWLLDVLGIVRSLDQTEFRLADVYAHENTLHDAHPRNLNIRPKIRQQLQKLRDLGIVQFLGDGRYRSLGVPTRNGV